MIPSSDLPPATAHRVYCVSVPDAPHKHSLTSPQLLSIVLLNLPCTAVFFFTPTCPSLEQRAASMLPRRPAQVPTQHRHTRSSDLFPKTTDPVPRSAPIPLRLVYSLMPCICTVSYGKAGEARSSQIALGQGLSRRRLERLPIPTRVESDGA